MADILEPDKSVKQRLKALHGLVLMPTYNNASTLLQVIAAVRRFADDILVVNDGSTDETAALLASQPDVHVIAYERNRGKGYALKTGLREAARLGYAYAITIDSDGQHYADDIAVFVEAAEQSPNTLFVGARNLQADNMPSKNTFANKFSNFWYWAETGIKLTDTQSGFRLYPLAGLADTHFITSRYEFEVEVLVRAAWKGIKVANVPIKVYYPPADERVSHFRPARDFTRISILNTYLVLVALLVYYPWRFLHALTWTNIKRFVRNHITHSPESNLRMSLAIGWGVCCGILPAWGYQMWIALAVAQVARLNKVLAVVASNISIPPMIPFILFGSYVVGCQLLGNPVSLLFSEVTFDSVMVNLWQYVLGACVLAVVTGVCVWLISWAVLSLFRKTH
ncbi:MAG: DUF2062 domain-containing protein [Bacteroidales bacterium]|nr:DUF2062 domain-containing protein [Bacteroidales bacterium]